MGHIHLIHLSAVTKLSSEVFAGPCDIWTAKRWLRSNKFRITILTKEEIQAKRSFNKKTSTLYAVFREFDSDQLEKLTIVDLPDEL